MAVKCPTLKDYTRDNACVENFAGLGTTVYIGHRRDLATPLTLTDNVYSTPTFKPGTGLYKIECQDEKNKIASASVKYGRGFALTGTIVVDRVDPDISLISRSINTDDNFYIFTDGEQSQILYDPNHIVKPDDGGLTSDTGDAADSDRQTQFEVKIQPVPFQNMYVEKPAKGDWDSLLLSGQTAGGDTNQEG